MEANTNNDLLEELELEFEHRYTEKDKEFVIVSNKKPVPPPVVFPWPHSDGRRMDL